MPTATAPTATRAGSFALRFVAWAIGLFGLLRLGWIEVHAVLPVTRLQGQLATRLSGMSALPVDVTLACSAADATALCLGAILAYPARCRVRLAGAGAGVALILALNTVRIGTLGRAAASPAWFNALHVYVWPGLLLLAVAGYVFGWMRFADRQRPTATARADDGSVPHATRLTRRFVMLTAAFLVIFIAASPLYLESGVVFAVAAFIARAAALTLRVLGIEATATGNVLSTARGGFLVTQECISTPLIPVYFAAVVAYSTTWRRRVLPLLAAVPLFVGLGITRLLVVALPAALVGSPLFLIHAFYQLLLAVVVVVLAAIWRHGAGATAWRWALLGCAVATVLVCLLGPLYARVVMAPSGATGPLNDPQGALAFLPAFQVGLYVALCLAAFAAARWRPFVIGLALLWASQLAVFAALHFALRHGGFAPQVRDVRAWALVAPLLVVVALVRYDRPRR